MHDVSLLSAFDRDGALEEAAARAETSSRSAFLRRAGMAAGGIAAGGAFAGLLPSIALGASVPQSDIDILNFALTLEYLEGAFYAEAVAGGALGKSPTARFATVVAQHEHSHVQFLRKVLGARAVAKPTFDFKGTTTDKAMFEATADVLENTGVHAYLGQVANIKTPAVLAGAGRILPVEARHAAWIRALRYPAGGPGSPRTPAPAAFEDGFTKAKILSIVSGTGFITG